MTLPTNPIAENVLGTMGAICWSVQLLPQAYKSYKRKDTMGLSSWMLAIWWFGGIFLGAYVVVQNINIPLIVQPQCFTVLSAVCWAQCLHYDQGKSKKFCFLALISAIVVAGGLEAAFIFGAKSLESHGNDKLTEAAGILSAIFIALGLLPQYVEIYKFRAVIGISLVFLLIDLLGGIFSFLSLIFAEGSFDYIASASYIIVVILEVGVFALAAILNPSHHRRVAAAKRADEEALSGTPAGPSATTTMEEIKLPEELEKPRGRSRDVVGHIWRGDVVTVQSSVGGRPFRDLSTDSSSVPPVTRPDSAERRRQESVNRTFRL
ncbi:hypothetical protein T439DRAFT_323864 [Meredithblackwellia eburnea MCA 4105]